MFKLSDLFSPQNYQVPEFSQSVKGNVFDVVNKKILMRSPIKILQKFFIPVGSLIIIWFLVLNNLDYLNIWKSVEIYIQSSITDSLTWKWHIIANIIETWNANSWLELNLEMQNLAEDNTIKDNNQTVENKTVVSINNTQVSQDIKTTKPNQIQNTILAKNSQTEINTTEIVNTQVVLPDNSPETALQEIETQLDSSLAINTSSSETSNEVTSTYSIQTTIQADVTGDTNSTMAIQKSKPDLTITIKSSIEYSKWEINNSIYIKNIWGTIRIWSLIEIHCYKDMVEIYFTRKLKSELISWWEYLVQKTIIDDYTLKTLSEYFNNNKELYLICTVNESKSLHEENYNNNEIKIRFNKTF